MENEEKRIKPSTIDVPKTIVDEMAKQDFGSGTKELLKDVYGNLISEQEIVERIRGFYGIDKLEVIWIKNPDDPNSIFVFIRNR